MSEPIHIISLGAGVQSSTMALMAAKGEITPMPKCAIFADTGDEPRAVYEWLDYLEARLCFPVHRVSADQPLSDSATEIRTSGKTGNTYLRTGLPVFYFPTAGIGSRQCTRDFKITPINQFANELREESQVIMWVGISADEALRMKPSQKTWATNIWPLVERGITRRKCLQWMEENDFAVPPRSACVYCPYHSDSEWRRLKYTEPAEFQRAIDFEKRLQFAASKATAIKGVPFLHKSCVALEDVDLRTESDRGQVDLFTNECEGMCGV